MTDGLYRWLFDPLGMPPRAFCLLWDPVLIWLNAACDLAIGCSGFGIALAIGITARRRLAVSAVYPPWLGAMLALCCGAVAWLDLLTLWVPAYGAQALGKAAFTAAAVAAAIAFWRELAADRVLSRALAARASPAGARRPRSGHGGDAGRAASASGEGRAPWVASASCMVLGYDAAELAALAPERDVHPEDLQRVAVTRASLTPDAPNASCRYRLRHKAGHWVWVEAVFQLANPGMSDESVMVALRDVTERRRFEEERDLRSRELETSNANLERLAQHLAQARDAAQRASRAKSRFLAGMSHELRTPLNGILGYAELLRMEGGLTEAQSARVEAMLGAGTHLLQMINCVLDLSEIEAEHTELRLDEVDLLTVAGACIDLVGPSAKAKTLALALAVSRDVPRVIRTDPTRLRQVLLNLLGNAVKFTASGAVALRLRMTDDAAAVRFEVVDTGPGIAPDRRHRLFQDFDRLDADAAGAVEGAGLGLFLSAQLAALMGGRLGHEDNPGGGSVFWLELPVSACASAAAAAPAGAVSPAGALVAPELERNASLRVLVVDDVPMNRDIAGSFLRAAGHAVTCAEGGREAVALAAAGDFDVILMDVRMPDVDGLEATRRIRALDGARGRVPIVALTALAFTDQVADCREAGMDEYVAKPFTPDALLSAVTRAAARPRAGDGIFDVPGDAAEPVAVSAEVPPPRVAARFGAEVPVLDVAALERTAAFLDPPAVAAHLRTLAVKSEALRDALAEAEAAPGRALAETAHALAGSAGMFGFERLALVARHFEHAALTGSPELSALADDLGVTLEATLAELRCRITLAVAA